MSKKKKIIIGFVIGLLALVLVLGAAGALLINSYLSKVQYDTDEELVDVEDLQEQTLTDEEIMEELLADEPDSDEVDSAQEEIDALESQMAEQLAQMQSGAEGDAGAQEDDDFWKDIYGLFSKVEERNAITEFIHRIFLMKIDVIHDVIIIQILL